MAKIDRIRLQPVQANVNISPALASEAKIAAAEESKAIQQTAQAFFQEAKVAAQNASYVKHMSQATLDLDTRVNERLQQREDANGNPTFESMPKDIERISQEVLQDRLSQVSDPAVRNKLQLEFLQHSAKAQRLAASTARKQQVDYTRATTTSAVEELSRQAEQADPSMVDSYIDQINEAMSNGVASGAFTAQERQQILQNTEDRILTNQALDQAEQFPEATLEAIQDGATFGLSERNLAKVEKMASAVVADNQRKEKQQAKENEEKIKSSQRLMSATLSTQIMTGESGEADIVRAIEEGHISPLQGEELKQELIRHNKKNASKSENFAGISEAILEGRPLTEFSNKEISEHADATIQLAERNAGRPLSFEEKAMLVAHYKGPVNRVADDLGAAIMMNTGDATSAVRAVEYLRQRESFVLENMDTRAKQIAVEASRLEKIGVDSQEAFRRSREAVMNIDEASRIERENDFKQVITDRKKDSTNNEYMRDLVSDAFYPAIFTEPDAIESGMTEELLRLEKQLYINGSTVEGAEDMIKDLIKTNYGVTEFNGGDYIMFKSPEKLYPGIPVADMKADLNSDLESFGVTEENVILKFDPMSQTADAPAWNVFRQHESGHLVPLLDENLQPLSYRPDIDKMKKQDEAEKAQIRDAAQKAAEVESKRAQNPAYRATQSLRGR